MIVLHTHIYSFSHPFPLWLIPGDWRVFSVLSSRNVLFIYPVCNGLHLPTPHSQSMPPQPHPSWQPQVCFLCLWVCFVDRDICVITYISHMSDVRWYLSFSFWVASLSIIISRSIHAAVTGFMSSLFMLTSLPVYLCTTSSLSIHLSMVVSGPWFLWIVLLWSLGCMCLFKLEFRKIFFF